MEVRRLKDDDILYSTFPLDPIRNKDTTLDGKNLDFLDWWYDELSTTYPSVTYNFLKQEN